MENNSRRNQQVQSPMHELSYGSNTRKTRLNPIYYFVIPFAGLIIFQGLKSNPILRLTLTLGLGILFYLISERETDIEPKTEQPTIYPTYSLTRTNLLCMLRNAQVRSRIAEVQKRRDKR